MQIFCEITRIYSTTTSNWSNYCWNYFWSFSFGSETKRFVVFSLNKYFFFKGQIPAWTNAIWPASSLPTFELIASLGLIFFMFFLGVELDLEQIKRTWKITIPIACSSIIIPGKYFYINIRKKSKCIFLVGIGCAVALWFYDLNTGITTSKAAFILFIGKFRNDKSYE